MRWSRQWRSGWLAILVGVLLEVSIAMDLPPHPRLLLSRDGIAQLKERINRYERARARWDDLKRRADAALREPVNLPPRGGNWWHYYGCPKHGAILRTGKQIGEWQWEHLCPVDNEIFRGDPTKPERDYDGVVISGIHQRFANAVRDLGIAYQVTGDRSYAEKAKAILLAYARRYRDYPLHTIRGEARIGGGRVTPQTLDESTWLIPMAQGADLIWETLSEDERDELAQNLFLPAVREVILPHRMGVHNIQCWKNSAVGLVGFLLGDEGLIRNALDDPQQGYWTQMRKGVTADGVWWERSWGYHFFTLSALWSLTEAVRNCGINLYGDELKRMFDAPFKFMMPNWRLPAFNDSTEVPLRIELGFARFGITQPIYELAFARYREPMYATLLSFSQRQDDFALLFGVGELPKPAPLRWRSANYPASGYTILAQGEGEQATWLCLKYGPHGGGHGHPDKLNFVLYARGQVLALDPGITRYGVPLHAGWYKTTLAHNTLVVDEANQKSAEGKCLSFGGEQGVEFVVAEAGDIYDGVRFVRSIAMLDENAIVVIDQVRCGRERLLDVALHLRGQWVNLPDGAKWTPPNKDGYRYLREATTRQLEREAVIRLRPREDWQIATTLLTDAPAELITAMGIGNHADDLVPMVMVRRKSVTLTLAWGIGLDGQPLALSWRPVRAEPSDAMVAAVEVRLPDGKVRTLVANPDGATVQVTLPDGTAWQTKAILSIGFCATEKSASSRKISRHGNKFGEGKCHGGASGR